ncbi:unnamed protein product [Medioppia subpectinata]|uniref:Uncharacterized protein n=1 Tax=Medioppia subpectinata TaxID=1979941 RepID=A0A7R9LC50_9ACAR|nr:unnamed protein product [Medioppia subpectinata]CAG2117652.1 unnamed protein product [Medioppia subpectinata]
MALTARQVLTLLGSCLLHLMVGSWNTFGNLNTYLTSYLRQNGSKEANYGQSVWYTPVAVTAFTSFTIISGLIVNRIGTRITCLLASLIYCGSVALTSITVKKSFLMVLMSYGFMPNMANGLLYSSVIVNCIKWFPNNKGLVTGVVTGVNAFSPFIFIQFQTFYLNPNNVKPNRDGYFEDTQMLSKVPQLFIILSAIYGVMGLIGICLTFDYKDSHPMPLVETDANDNPMSTSMVNTAIVSEDNEVLVVTPSTSPHHYSVGQNHYTIRRAIRTRFFWMLCYINDDHYLAVVLSLSYIINGIGGVFWGKVLDVLKFRDTIIAINSITAICTFSLIISSYVYQKLLFVIWDFVLFFTMVGVFAAYLPEVVRKFGDRNAIAIYGIVHTGPVFVSLALSPVLELCLNSFGWFPTFCTVGAFNTLGMIIIMVSYSRLK